MQLWDLQQTKRSEERDMVGDFVNEIKAKQAEILSLKHDFQLLLVR